MSSVLRATSIVSANRVAKVWARSFRWLLSSSLVSIVRKMSRIRATSRRPSAKTAVISNGNGAEIRWLCNPLRTSSSIIPILTMSLITLGSAMIRFTTPAKKLKLPACNETPTVSLMMSSNPWASSTIRTSCSGSNCPPEATWSPYR